MVATKQWTVDEVLALPDDGNRYELIDGELLATPAPSLVHQYIADGLQTVIQAWLGPTGRAVAVTAPVDVRLTPMSLVQPDVSVLPLREKRRPRRFEEAGALLLAVEVVSPSSAQSDRVRKRAFYLREGVPEYWIVDAEARVVERWHQGDKRPEILSDRLEWHPFPDLPAFELNLAAFFAETLDG